jgi:hypothetical protein
MYSYQPEGWLDPHTMLAPDAHTHTPHTTIARRTKPGFEWGRVASSFPPPYCTQPGNDEVHYLAKVGIVYWKWVDRFSLHQNQM